MKTMEARVARSMRDKKMSTATSILIATYIAIIPIITITPIMLKAETPQI